MTLQRQGWEGKPGYKAEMMVLSISSFQETVSPVLWEFRSAVDQHPWALDEHPWALDVLGAHLC